MNNETNDKLVSILKQLIFIRNNLHFLVKDYANISVLSVDDYIFLRDYVLEYIDSFGEQFKKENLKDIETGKLIIETLVDRLYDE